MKYLLILMLLPAVIGCKKENESTCVCKDYGNNFEEVSRTKGIDGSQCSARQIDWMKIKPDVRCNLE